MTSFLFVLRLAKDLARTLKEGLERKGFLVEELQNILLHTQASTQWLKITQKCLILPFVAPLFTFMVTMSAVCLP